MTQNEDNDLPETLLGISVKWPLLGWWTSGSRTAVGTVVRKALKTPILDHSLLYCTTVVRRSYIGADGTAPRGVRSHTTPQLPYIPVLYDLLLAS
jgi:hypothetical protein